MNNEHLKSLVTQVNYLLGSYKLTIDEMKEVDGYKDNIPEKLKLDQELILQNIIGNMNIIEDIVYDKTE